MQVRLAVAEDLEVAGELTVAAYSGFTLGPDDPYVAKLADAAARYDLLRPTFRHSCLNRLQLRNTLQMVDLTDQAE